MNQVQVKATSQQANAKIQQGRAPRTRFTYKRVSKRRLLKEAQATHQPLPLLTIQPQPAQIMNLNLANMLLPVVVIISLATACATNAPDATQLPALSQHEAQQNYYYHLQQNVSKELHQEGQVRLPRSPAQATDANRHRQAHFVELESDSVSQRVAVGRSVRFKCVVTDIGDHVVAWFHKDRRILLAIDNKTIAWRDRIQVSSQANSVFFLQIDSVQLNDKVSLSLQTFLVPLQC